MTLAIEPMVSNVNSLQLAGFSSMSSRSVSSPHLRRLLVEARRLKELEIEYPIVDIGTLKAISELRPPALRKISFGATRNVTPKTLRLNALEGFLRKMASSGESKEKMQVIFHARWIV